ncbi:hypothetical protein EAE99_011777 [Botrytis elliptica]|nr:hypothetical protein EAE99_011777 [Botrytis elliptica]
MSGNRSSERGTRDSHRSESRHTRGSRRADQEPRRQSDQQASSSSTSHHHAVGASQQQFSQETGQPISANELEFNNYIARNPRNIPNNFYNSTGDLHWGPLHPPIRRLASLEQTHVTGNGTESTEHFTGELARWKYSHMVDKRDCQLGMERALLRNAPVMTQAQGEYLHGQAFVDSNNHGQTPLPAPIPAYSSMPPPAAQNTYANTQSRYVSPYPPQQPQQPQQQYTQQPPTIQPVPNQSSYEIYDEEYENEQLDSAAAANETVSGPGWRVEPSVIVPRSAYPSSESRGHRSSGRRHR